MSVSDKKVVEGFYKSDFSQNPDDINNFLHPDAELYWNSSAGFNKMNFQDIANLSKEIARSSESLRAEISHLLMDKDQVTIRFTYHIRTVENPDEEIPMAHFIAIWKIQDGKMLKGYQISQLADESPENLSSFLSTNF
ncbi:nuclear transport factor 2 family protein [Antarcticibacterium sp. 1MA-6-2]|uniref:nuclear transport factor 2 family protein n=1 Tax=Antarcticibacterium sp. 1MA-6-2 TaxID=2908210 RepID=UPI001F3C0920|nr:nuclear transport factor 2 family protein [Antarcticibacterium sp. 1MA-6-2]UJH91545.1 nuclear transport factor 2 family protein [Antarcticibacterium sp. 1MA-6-2]